MENELFFDIAKNDFPCFLTHEDENDKLNLRGVIFQIGIDRRSWFCRWITRLLVSLGITKYFASSVCFRHYYFTLFFYVSIILLHARFLLSVEYKPGDFLLTISRRIAYAN